VQGFNCTVHIEISKRVDKSLDAGLILLSGAVEGERNPNSVQGPSGSASLMCPHEEPAWSTSWRLPPHTHTITAACQAQETGPWSPAIILFSAPGSQVLEGCSSSFQHLAGVLRRWFNSHSVPQMIDKDRATCHLNPESTVGKTVHSFLSIIIFPSHNGQTDQWLSPLIFLVCVTGVG
jgi:hypothetical protein